jgi:hypothetical protein
MIYPNTKNRTLSQDSNTESFYNKKNICIATTTIIALGVLSYLFKSSNISISSSFSPAECLSEIGECIDLDSLNPVWKKCISDCSGSFA